MNFLLLVTMPILLLFFPCDSRPIDRTSAVATNPAKRPEAENEFLKCVFFFLSLFSSCRGIRIGGVDTGLGVRIVHLVSIATTEAFMRINSYPLKKNLPGGTIFLSSFSLFFSTTLSCRNRSDTSYCSRLVDEFTEVVLLKSITFYKEILPKAGV